ncbi:hypothetical protein GP486_001696 [Trichoglossum hirsutum]|uniref:Uncharacterized protein n=1 Tax=Trichoglossum hirsutum TaxID=265104 RepID=A0A9P8LGH7_9PEZI|nr:hypothetical protein GP486_001696 [Trichoglossum hirsutum]
MKGCGYGYAVYHPIGTSKLYLGAYGFFDQEGDWILLGSVGRDTEGYPDSDESKPFSVEVMVSSEVTANTLSKVGLQMEYRTESDFGAVLLARPWLIKHFTKDETFFKRWGQQNFATLLNEFPILKDYGLWIITKTCQTPYCAISTFGGKQKAVLAGFSAEAFTSEGKLSAGGSWHLETRSGTWRTFGSYETGDDGPEPEAEPKEEPEDVVVFLVGYRMEHKWWHTDKPPHTDAIRDTSNTGRFSLNEEEYVEWKHHDGSNFD